MSNPDPNQLREKVSRISLFCVIIGIVMGVSNLIEVSTIELNYIRYMISCIDRYFCYVCVFPVDGVRDSWYVPHRAAACAHVRAFAATARGVLRRAGQLHRRTLRPAVWRGSLRARGQYYMGNKCCKTKFDIAYWSIW